jgi:hypothetical protein
MDFKEKAGLNLAVIFSLLLISSCQCAPDVYGDNILLEIPISVELQSDTLNSGDTIWISASFDKEIMEMNSGRNIFLEDFQFFTELGISEISDTVQKFPSVSTFSIMGSIEELPLITAISYPIMYEETENSYEFRGGVIAPEEPGLYGIAFSSSNLLFEEYDHPAMFQCGNDHRSVVNVSYKNESTTRANYENVYFNTRIPFFLELSTFEGFQLGGSVAFYVR